MRRVRCAVPLPAARASAQRGCRGRAGRAGAGRAVPPQEEAQPGAEPPRSRPEPRGSVSTGSPPAPPSPPAPRPGPLPRSLSSHSSCPLPSPVYPPSLLTPPFLPDLPPRSSRPTFPLLAPAPRLPSWHCPGVTLAVPPLRGPHERVTCWVPVGLRGRWERSAPQCPYRYLPHGPPVPWLHGVPILQEVGSEHCPQAETGTWIVVLPWRTPMPA